MAEQDNLTRRELIQLAAAASVAGAMAPSGLLPPPEATSALTPGAARAMLYSARRQPNLSAATKDGAAWRPARTLRHSRESRHHRLTPSTAEVTRIDPAPLDSLRLLQP